MTEVTLNRQQIGKLVEMYTHFKEIQQFTIQVDHSSGIGTGIVIAFNLFNDDNKHDTTVDITDVSTW
ncbi:MAG: hypothetical protein EBZ49_00985 [Proteobacteria bacterium]|nr:hypothetical protein [Pseudomonadota bacterium]